MDKEKKMKVMFISDIHGSFYWLEKAMHIYETEAFEKLIILGDILYHGPRNPLPKGYDCQKVANLLNGYKDDIVAVRGNCDAEVDQMLLAFDIMQQSRHIEIEGYPFFLSHGHHDNEDHIPILADRTIFAYGHFHVPIAKKIDQIYVVNPSSLSLPKQGKPSYGIYENHVFTIKEVDGKEVKKIDLKR